MSQQYLSHRRSANIFAAGTGAANRDYPANSYPHRNGKRYSNGFAAGHRDCHHYAHRNDNRHGIGNRFANGDGNGTFAHRNAGGDNVPYGDNRRDNGADGKLHTNSRRHFYARTD